MMKLEEFTCLIRSAAELGDWFELAAFESSGRFVLILNDELSVTLSPAPDSELLSATFDVGPLPDSDAARHRLVELLLNANARQQSPVVSFGVSPFNESVTLSTLIPVKLDGEHELVASLSKLAALVEAWRPLVASVESSAPAFSIAQEMSATFYIRA
jgi:hypothetical protein